MNFPKNPTWDRTIRFLFSEPYWIDETRRAEVAAGWKGCMSDYNVMLDNYESVREWSQTIYYHLRSKSMPLTEDVSQFWPYEALNLLCIWINEGCRRNDSQTLEYKPIIPPTEPKLVKLRIRKNILDLTQVELNLYRMKLNALDISKVNPKSAWQKLAYIHTNWCLHYQEAFLMWHRAYLLYFEQLIDFPIPYWNFMSQNATKDGHREAGLPQAFKDETYTHPVSGETCPNPLRFAIAKDGRSKGCQRQQSDTINGEDCKYVQRDSVLYTEGEHRRLEREEKLALLGKYQRQFTEALRWPVFSTLEGHPGYPWANIQTFDPPAPDAAYPNKCDFDGLLEQPHDNIHGWVGPDMADNAYTAFDPIFWSYHSNIDRIFENWKREHPAAIFTSNFPIRPFIGSLGKEIDPSEDRSYLNTAIGDMAKDSRALGYDYDPPKVPDSSGTMYNEWPDSLYVIFNNVKCTYSTYAIDIFLNESDPKPEKAKWQNLHYVGKMMRLGMGIEDDNKRCIKDGVTRVINASYNAYYLKLNPRSPLTISLIVTDTATGKILTPEEYMNLPGFMPIYIWREDRFAVEQQASPKSCSCNE